MISAVTRSASSLRQRLRRWSAGGSIIGAHNRFWHLVLLVGLASGLIGAVYIAALKQLIKWIGPDRWSDPVQLVILGLAGIAVAVLTRVLGSPGDVELLVDNIHVSGSRSDIRQLRSLIPVSLIGISAGSAIGPEAPLVQSTGTIGNWVALRFNLSPREARVLTITGMASGFAVLFGAPLGSAVFALEILHRRGLQYYEALLPSGIGALTGYAAYVFVNRLGLDPVWHFPLPHDLRSVDLLVGLAAGVLGAIVAIAFTYSSHFLRRLFHRFPSAVRPLIGGLALGGMAFVTPFALTFGEVQIQTIVSTKLAVGTLLVAVLFKLLASSTIVSAGWRGGFIIPLFFMGACLGSVGAQWTGVDRVVAMTALMAACNVGVTKTPMGSTLVVAEMAGLRLLPSTLIASIVALFLTSSVAMIETQRERDDPFDGPPVDEAPVRVGVTTPEAAAGAGAAPPDAVRQPLPRG